MYIPGMNLPLFVATVLAAADTAWLFDRRFQRFLADHGGGGRAELLALRIAYALIVLAATALELVSLLHNPHPLRPA